MRRPLLPALALAIALTLAACSDPSTSSSGSSPTAPRSVAPAASTPATSTLNEDQRSMATPLMSDAEILALGDRAEAFIEHFGASHADAEEAFRDFADDAKLYDPTNGDVTSPGDPDLASRWESFAEMFPKLDAHLLGVFVSPDAIAGRVEVDHLFPARLSPVPEIRLFGMRGGLATSLEFSYGLDWSNTSVPVASSEWTCFAPSGGCGDDVRALIDEYLAAWSSGDAERISALYAQNADFADGMLGLAAQGPAAIAALATGRFGQGGVSCEPLHVYVQTWGGDWGDGRPIGIGLHYRCALGSGSEAEAIESLAMLDLGTRTFADADFFEPDPDGLIAREIVLQDPASLASLAS